jgi:hypothetical protein
MSAWQFQIAATLTSLFTVSAAMDVSTIAMPFEFRFRYIGDNMIFKFAGRLQVVATATRALCRTNVVLEKDRIRRRIRAENAWMLAMFLTALVLRRPLAWRPFLLGSFAALKKGLNLVFKLRNPTSQFGVLRLELGYPKIAWIVHDPAILATQLQSGKRA